MSSLEDTQVSGDITGNGATSASPQPKPPTKKKSRKNISVKKAKSITKEASNVELASDAQITGEMESQDKALHNYNQTNSEGNEESSKPLTKKKSKTSKVRLAKTEAKPAEDDGTTLSKEPNDPKNVQELIKLKECLECQWAHNYHPCLLSSRTDNQKCKDEMKRKGYDYEEPKQQCCLKKGTCDADTAVGEVAEEKIVSEVPKAKKLPTFRKSKQLKQKSKPEVANNEESKPEIITPKQTDEQYKPPIVTPKQTEEKYKPPIIKTKRTGNESKSVVIAPEQTPEKSKPTVIISRPTQAVVPYSKSNQDQSKPPVIISKTKLEQSELPPKPKKTLSIKIKPSSSKTKSHVNFNKEAPPKTASTASLKKKSSKTSKTKLKGVKLASSKQDTEALDFINKITSKSSKKLGGKKHASSVPVSTRESRSRFNPQQPSPSDTNLPPVTISASEVKCFNPEVTISTGTCEVPALVPLGKTKSKTKSGKSKKSTVKKENDNELVGETDKTNYACVWNKNYHPCDKPNNNKDGDNATATDQIICKAWKKKLKELDPQARSTRSSLKSIVDVIQSNVLTTTPSEKAYIDKVVRTAVKLAKKNNPNVRRRRRSRVDSIPSGFSRVNSMVDNAITAAATVVHNRPRPMTASKRSKRSADDDFHTGSTTSSLGVSQVHALVDSGIVVDSNRMPRTGKKSKKGNISIKPSLPSVSQSTSKKRLPN